MNGQSPQKRPGWEVALTEKVEALRFWNSPEFDSIIGAPDLSDADRGLVDLLHGWLTPEPAFITSDFLELVEHAAKDFKPEPLLSSDIVVPQALMFFERPLVFTELFKPKPRDYEFDGLAVSVDEDEKAVWCVLMYRAGLWAGRPLIVNVKGWGALRHGWFPAVGLHLRLGEEDANTHGLDVGAHGLLIQTIFRLLQQDGLADVARVPVGKRARKKAGVASEDGYVLRVRLPRHRSSATGASENPVEWSHRWLVGGHWRNQWYPSINAHRQRYIAPYVKGPEDKPLVTRTRVFEAVA